MNRPSVPKGTSTHLTVALLALLLSSPAALPEQSVPALELPQAVSIRELLQIVREKSPRYALAHTQIDSAQAEVVAANVLPNPKISYGRYDQAGGRRNTQFDGPSQQNITVEIPMLLAGQRGARKEAAERQVEVAQSRVEGDHNQLIREIWRLFAQLLANQQQVAVLDDARSDLARLQAIITGKQQAGTASQYDVLRIVQEVKSLDTRLENAQTDVSSTTGELASLLGFSGWRPHALGTLMPIGVSADTEKLWQNAEHRNPDLETARRERIAADYALERAETERWPVPSLIFGTAFTDNPYGNTTFAGVSVDLPIFDRGQGGMARAAADIQAAQLKRELLVTSTRLELDRAVDVLKRRRATLEKAESGMVAPLPTLKQMAEDAYRLGQTSLIELLDSSRTRTEIKLNHLELLQNEIEAELDVLAVSGLLDEYFLNPL